MATSSTTTVIDHTSDAGFRTWVAEFIAQLIAVGLTQTADTGQINTATATRPATSTNGGYAIFRFNDTLHATVPIFIRFDFGTDTSANNPRIQVLVGSGSNGSGTITGQMLGQRAMTCTTVPGSTVTSYVSRFCYNATLGFLGIAWKTNAPSTESTQGMLFLGRTTDSTGAATGTGVYMIAGGSTLSATGSGGTAGSFYQQLWNASTTLRWPVDAGFSSNGNPFGFWPHNNTTTQVGADTYVVPLFYTTPALDTHLHCGLVLRGEVPVGNTFSVAIKGATARTYLSVGNPASASTSLNVCNGAPTTVGCFMLWE